MRNIETLKKYAKMNLFIKTLFDLSFIITTLDGSKIMMEKEKTSFRKGGVIRKIFAVVNMTMLTTAVARSLLFANEMVIEIDKKMTIIDAKGDETNNMNDIHINE